jgi:nucleotide-binding universal stress UspA family protein
MTSSIIPSTAGAYDSAPSRATGPVLVAVRGGEGSAPVLRAAKLVAERLGTTPHVVAVLEPLSAYYPELGMAVLPPELVAEQEATLFDDVQRELQAVVDEGQSWPFQIVAGAPARTIARLAQDWDARLIIMGLGQHRPIDRVFGSETALQTIRAADRPVLAVPEGFTVLPRHAVVAVDFSAASVRAVEEVVPLIGAGGTLTLVHVRPFFDELLRDAAESWNRAHNQRVTDLFQRIIAGLQLPASLTVQHVIPTGNPAETVLEFAERRGADLIGAGSSGAGFIERLRVGSVATQLLRRTMVTLLVVPRPSAAEAARIERLLASTQESVAAARWPALVETFSRRNAGRPTRLEIDDPAIGAQLQESGFLLLGASYDHREDRLEFILGEAAAGVHRLSHGVAGVASIAVLTDPDGRDRALRAQHGPGQTVLTFVD